jgi:uncharacterized oligopeptide transporter (OPT) family protein
VISDFLQMLWMVIQYMVGAILGGFVGIVFGVVVATILDVAIDLATHGRNIRAKATKEVRPASVVAGLFVTAVVAAAMLLTAAKRFGWF